MLFRYAILSLIAIPTFAAAKACRNPNQSLCGVQCVNLQTNAQHCGGCKTACSSGQSCVSGVCTTPPQTCSLSGAGNGGCASGCSCEDTTENPLGRTGICTTNPYGNEGANCGADCMHSTDCAAGSACVYNSGCDTNSGNSCQAYCFSS